MPQNKKKQMKNNAIKVNFTFSLIWFYLLFFIIIFALFALTGIFHYEDGQLRLDFSVAKLVITVACFAVFFVGRLMLFNKYKADNSAICGFPVNVQTPESQPDNEVNAESEITDYVRIEESFRLSSFKDASLLQDDFIRSCYTNTFFITLPNSIENVSIPNNFRKFYLNFDFFTYEQGNSDDEEEADSSKKEIPLRESIVNGRKMKWYVDSKDGDELRIYALVYFNVNTDAENEDDYAYETVTFYMNFQLTESGNAATSVSLRVASTRQKKSYEKIIGFFHDDENTESVTDSISPLEFISSTRITPYTPELREKIRFRNKKRYKLRVNCFSSFSNMECPACRNKISGLGVRGIVLFKSSNQQVIRTSEHLTNYINGLHNGRMKTLVDFVMNRMNSELRRYDKKIDCIRIPLAELDHTTNTLVPFTCNEYEKEWEFLSELNEVSFPNFRNDTDTINEIKHDKKLILLSPRTGHIVHFKQNYIHSSMVSQLCDKCYSPLPNRFHEFHEVVSIMFFGDTNAGKTVLLCSGYLITLEKNRQSGVDSLNEFNEINLYYDNLSAESYDKKSERIRNGEFPSGTSENESIPGRLSELAIYDQRSQRILRYLFNTIDMVGKNAAQNWDANTNFAYVHSLFGDTARLVKNELYSRLIDVVPSNHQDRLEYNAQIYLTKIDEFPLFLYNEIRNLNDDYASRLRTDKNHVKLSSSYTLELLYRINSALAQDFSGLTVGEIISDSVFAHISAFMKSHYMVNLSKDMKYSDFLSYTIKELKPLETYSEDSPMKNSILTYLYGINNISRNFAKFRQLIDTILENMNYNITHNENSYFWFSVYAVSATGFGAIQSCGNSAQFAPEFVSEAEEMLQYTTCRFNDERCYRKSRDCYRYIFGGEQFEVGGVSGSFMEIIRCINDMPVFIKAVDLLSDEEKELIKWYNKYTEGT